MQSFAWVRATTRPPRVVTKSTVRAVGERRRVELSRFLVGLGIPEVGFAVAGDLAAHFRAIDAIRTASPEDLEDVHGVGPKMSAAIRGFLDDERVAAALDNLLARGFDFILPEEPRDSGARWAGKTFVLTGTLEMSSRGALKKLLQESGARVTSAVSSRTDFLIAGANAGSKLARAQALGVEVLDETRFRERFAEELGIVEDA